MTGHKDPPPKPQWNIRRVVAHCYRLLRNTVFVLWVVFALISISLTTTAWAAYQTWKAAQLSYELAEKALEHRGAVARATQLSSRLGELRLRHDRAVATAAQLSSRITEMATQHRRAVARAIAKARIRRLASAIPFAGAGAAVYFERQSYYEWQELYPNGTPNDYACDMATLTAEVIDEVFQDLPASIRPQEGRFVPDCRTP